MAQDNLKKHVLSTYLTLRYGTGIIALCFPIFVYLYGLICGVSLQNSISAYYWADGFESAPVRVWFVGVLFALASFFYLYKGFTAKENIAEVERLDLTNSLKTVVTEGAIYSGKAIILATGRQPIRLKLETNCERIHYCSVCDGAAYAGKQVLVVGGGNSSFDESLYLLSLGVSEIVMVEAMENCCACESTQAKLGSHCNVSIKTSTCVTGISEDGNGCRVTLENLKCKEHDTVCVDGIFVFIGQCANTHMFHGIIDLDENGYILTGPNRETNVPGVFAAGDVVQKKYRYLTTAMSDGTIAALSAATYIRG
jgi:thioredoxin reductase (NADPH)